MTMQSTPPTMMAPRTSSGLVDRLIGVVTLKAPVYREIADDTTGTMQAAIIVVVVSLITGLVGGLFVSSSAGGNTAGGAVTGAIGSLIAALIGWLIGGWLTAFVATTFFQGKTNTGEMLRVFGYTRIFTILGIIPVIGGLIGAILGIIGNVIGIREAAEFDTTKAILTAIIVGVIVFIVLIVLGTILAAIGLGAGVLTAPR